MAKSDKPDNPQPAGSGGATAAPAKAKPSAKRKNKTKQLPPYNVILLDDNDHTYEYVIQMLRSIFAHPEERAFAMAKEVDKSGRVIVLTTHKELAELKRDQIHAWGPDKQIATCKGSMSATIEPA